MSLLGRFLVSAPNCPRQSVKRGSSGERTLPEHSAFEAFVPALRAVCAFLDELELPSAIVGGIAFGIQAAPRATKDIDALIVDERLRVEWVTEVASRHGLATHSEASLESARKSRVLKLQHLDTGVQVDILIGMFPFEAAAAVKAQRMKFEGISLSVCRPEDLIILKAFAGRLQDLADIDRLLEIRIDIDRAYVERELRKLARQVEAPSIWSNVEALPGWTVES